MTLFRAAAEWLTRRRLSVSTIVALALLCVALAGLAASTLALMARDRAALMQRFGRDRLKQVSEAAREIKADLEDVAQDLQFASRLLEASSSEAEQQRVLAALLGLVKPYRAAGIYSLAKSAPLIALDPRATFSVPQPLLVSMEQTARKSLRGRPEHIEVSFPVEGPAGGLYRVFALGLRNAASGGKPRAVVLVVDTAPFLSKLRLVASDPESQLLVLGPHGRLVPTSDSRFQRALRSGKPPGVLGRVVEQMRKGQSGTAILDRREAARHGFGAADLIAAYASIRLQSSSPWSVGMFSSLSQLRALERGMMWRLGLGSAGIALVLLVFGSYIVASTRRAAVLRERLRHADELAYLHEKADKILENIPAGVMTLSEDGRISAMNRVLRQRMPDVALGSQLSEAFPRAPAATVERILTLIARARRANSTCSIHGERLALFGEEGQYSLHAVPLEHRFPEARVLVVLEDFTEVRALESQLLRSEKLATVGMLAAGVAHEIGTPLGVVRGRAEYIMGRLGTSHRDAAGLRVIMEQIDRVTRTIRELLDFSRIKPAAVAPVALAPLARKVVDLLRYEAARRAVDIQVDVPEDLPLLLANADQLQQVLVNLLVNACDACSSAGAVTLTARSLNGRAVQVEIVDTGCGIPVENRHRIFDPFFTTKKRGQGTGLGLTVVSQIVRNHAAEIEVESEPGRGTRAMLTWPMVSCPGVTDVH